jgi:threonine/homoserine/homoserine lactone efflux protein
MFDAIHNYPGFLLAIIVFQLLPGPGMLTILETTARKGFVAGVGAGLGLLIGDLIIMLIAIAGLEAVLLSYPQIFHFIQLAGAFYLMVSGVLILRNVPHNNRSEDNQNLKFWQGLRHAIVISMTNPQVILFFAAFFPQFVTDPPEPLHFLIMVVHVTLISLLFQLGLVFLGNRIAPHWAGVHWIGYAIRGAASLIMLSFGFKLIMGLFD